MRDKILNLNPVLTSRSQCSFHYNYGIQKKKKKTCCFCSLLEIQLTVVSYTVGVEKACPYFPSSITDRYLFTESSTSLHPHNLNLTQVVQQIFRTILVPFRCTVLNQIPSQPGNQRRSLIYFDAKTVHFAPGSQ